MAFNQFGAGSNVWKSDKYYALHEIAQQRVRKFHTTATNYSLSLNPQPGV